MKKSDFKIAYSIVREIINEWDPYGLIATGAPEDEFDSEVHSIVGQIPRIQSSNDAIHAIKRVFASNFEPERFSIDECSEVGRKLYVALDSKGIL